MTAKLITLKSWASATYGDAAPKMPTLYKWAKNALIYPVPEKHGRDYFVDPEAQYVTTHAAASEASAGHSHSRVKKTSAPQESAKDLMTRLINDRNQKAA